MGEKMTLEQVRMQIAALGYNETRSRWLETIDAHLTQPAQAVDVGEIHRVIVYMRDRVGECANEHYVADHEDMEEWIAMLTAALPKDSNGAEDTPDAAR